MPERTRQRQAFDAYFQLGAERSIERLHAGMTAAGRHPPTLRTLYEWSRRFRWQHRLEDLEQQARETEDAARVAAIREMAERHAKEGLLLQASGAEWLTTVEEVSADAATRAIVEGAKLERLARGEPTERTVEHAAGDPRLERFSDAELDTLIAAAERALAGAEPPAP